MRNIVVLAFEGAQVLDIAGPMEVFSGGNHYADQTEYRIECLGVGKTQVQMSNGLTLATKHYTHWRGKIETLIVPGASEAALTALRHDNKFHQWLSQRLASAKRIVSVCTGAFVLAELGLLDGRTASTHWGACARLQAMYPSARVDPDAIFSKDGNVYTSAGVTAGIDLALSLVEEDLGKDICLRIARNLVLYYRRPGGQSQFSVPLDIQSAADSRISKIADYIRSNPQADLSVNNLADKFSISARQLSRLFQSELGSTPAGFVSEIRINCVRTYLEETQLGLKQVAQRCGYRSADAMSRAFRQQFGISPGQYRAGFS